jgi:predicted membrane protein
MSKSKSNDTNGAAVVGVIFFLFGLFLFLKQTGIYLPKWLFTWEWILIAIGLVTGVKNGFRGSAWLIILAIGAVCLLDNFFPDIRAYKHYIWPLLAMMIGLILIANAGGGASSCKKTRKNLNDPAAGEAQGDYVRSEYFSYPNSSYSADMDSQLDQRIRVNTFFASQTKVNHSKYFSGGSITTIFGGTEINLLHADFQGVAEINLSILFGGCEIIVPSDWEVRTEATCVFGGIEDNRKGYVYQGPSAKKILIIRGSCIFGGVDIKSY